MNQTPANRRRFPRYRTNLPVRVRDRQQRTHVGHCFVIAKGGLGATLPESISVGSRAESPKTETGDAGSNVLLSLVLSTSART
jgi:hypothetical protein